MYTKCLKYRIFTTKAQETKLCQTLETCKDVYNSLLNERKYEYEVNGVSPSRYEQSGHFPEWSKKFPEIREVFSQVLQEVSGRVDLAFRAFFRRVKAGETPGYPRSKGDGYDSFTYPQAGFKIVEDTVYLSKIGTVKVVLHRPIEGRVKTCNVKRSGNKWFVCFAVEVEEDHFPASAESVGIDVGISQFAALSNGEMIANPRFFRKGEKALAKAQRKLSKQKRGSKDRRKAKKVVARIHERISNRRHNFVHQESRKIVNRFGFIAVEKLAVKNMLGNHCLAKSIQDASWGMFRNVLASKAESAGRKFAEVNPAWTSQDCSGCKTRVKKKLSERVHYCPNCGLSLDRDTNAAINILNNGMGQHTDTGIPV